MILGTNAGHTLKGLGSGAIGLLEESICTRQINNHFINYAKKHHTVGNYTVDSSTDYLYDVVNMINKKTMDFAISHHLNCHDDVSANGVEIWIYDLNDKNTLKLANNILDELQKLGLKNRGVKESKKFYFLRATNPKALLIEYLFCSNKKDVSLYNPEKLAIATVDGINKFCGIGPTIIQTNNVKLDKYKNGAYDKAAIVVNVENEDVLNVRSARDSKSRKVGSFANGQKIRVNYCLDNWFSTYSTGSLGFINGAYVKIL
ncbi:MAG: N-acetylmuramoyl-L-alanine amidase [Paraclostridium sp.]